MQLLYSLREVWDRYDAFFVDIWGVLHDGTRPYPYVQETLHALANAGKYVVLLSNAPRRVERAVRGLAHVGLDARAVHGIVTSGEVTRTHLLNHYAQRTFFFLGSPYDEDLLEGAALPRTRNIDDAHYVLNVGHFYDQQPISELRSLLQTMRQRSLVMICANPDKEIITQDGTIFPCAGEIAEYYQQLGGDVHFIGKPYPAVYEQARALVAAVPTSRILAVGDNPSTDIAGARAYGIDALLIAGGMWERSLYVDERLNEEALHRLCAHHDVIPHYVMRYLSDGML